jgi:hypothetical protein
VQQDTDSPNQQQELPSACDDPLLGKQQRSSSSSSTDSSTSNAPAGSALLPWYRDRQVVLVLLAYGTVCLLFCAIDELTPIFASAPLQQGEGWVGVGGRAAIDAVLGGSNGVQQLQ